MVATAWGDKTADADGKGGGLGAERGARKGKRGEVRGAACARCCGMGAAAGNRRASDERRDDDHTRLPGSGRGTPTSFIRAPRRPARSTPRGRTRGAAHPTPAAARPAAVTPRPRGGHRAAGRRGEATGARCKRAPTQTHAPAAAARGVAVSVTVPRSYSRGVRQARAKRVGRVPAAAEGMTVVLLWHTAAHGVPLPPMTARVGPDRYHPP